MLLLVMWLLVFLLAMAVLLLRKHAGAGVLGSEIGSAVSGVGGATGHTVGTCLQQLPRQMLRQMGPLFQSSQVHCSASLVTWLIWALCIGVCKMYSKVLLVPQLFGVAGALDSTVPPALLLRVRLKSFSCFTLLEAPV